jgi:hypothetical protein
LKSYLTKKKKKKEEEEVEEKNKDSVQTKELLSTNYICCSSSGASVYVCVCERERESERERDQFNLEKLVEGSPSSVLQIQQNQFCILEFAQQ